MTGRYNTAYDEEDIFLFSSSFSCSFGVYCSCGGCRNRVSDVLFQREGLNSSLKLVLLNFFSSGSLLDF